MDALSERDRARQEIATLTIAIERYANTLILDQPLDGTSPLNRRVVAHDLRAFVNFAVNGGLLSDSARGRARPNYDPRSDYPERYTEGPI